MLADFRAGAAAVAPMLIGVIPFGLVAGTTPVAAGFGTDTAMGLSLLVFAGASQLATTEVLADGGSAWTAALVAWTINLRMMLYSASLAPFLAHEPRRKRLLAAYLMVDQNYALSVTRWQQRPTEPSRRLPFYLGGGALIWMVWQLATLAGALLSSTVPDSVPLDFAVPLVFLVILVPTCTTPPGLVAALAGGAGAVAALELGAAHLSVIAGAVVGIIAGALTDRAQEPAP